MGACLRKLVIMAVLESVWMAAVPVTAVFSAPPRRGVAAAEPAGVETLPDEGRRHLAPGKQWGYKSSPPTSGPHDQGWSKPGFYDTEQPVGKLVHSLEHGNVVIYYGRPAPETIAGLKALAKGHQGKWDGVIVAPLPGLDGEIILTAWRKRLRLGSFDALRVQGFLDAFLGHGPESGE